MQDRNLSPEVIAQISGNDAAMKSRKVRLALAAHSRTPRRIALRLIRELYTFDLMQFSLLPSVAADLKRFADDLLVGRLASVAVLPAESRVRCCWMANRAFGKRPWRIHVLLNLRSSKPCCARKHRLLLSKLFVSMRSGRCGLRFAWLCCEISTRRWLALLNWRGGFLPHDCATYCILPDCRKKLRLTCGRIWKPESDCVRKSATRAHD